MPELPALGRGPFEDGALVLWSGILKAAKDIVERCLEYAGKPRAGVAAGFVAGMFFPYLLPFIPCFVSRRKRVCSFSKVD